MATITIQGKKRRLRFDMTALECIEAEFGSMDKALRGLRDPASSMRTVLRIAPILIRSGGDAAGCDLSHLAMTQLIGRYPEVQKAVVLAISDGMETQIARKKKKDGPVDMVLKELEEKRAEESGGVKARELYAYGLTAGLQLTEMRALTPGFILDMFAGHNEYISGLFGGGKSAPGAAGRKRRPRQEQRPDW